MTPEAFERDVAHAMISAPMRFGELHLKGDKVNVRWNKNEGSLHVTGGYGMVTI